MTTPCSFPFFDRLSLIFPDFSSTALRSSFLQPKRVSFRLNTVKVSSWSEVRDFFPASLSYRSVPDCADVFSVDPAARSLLTHAEAVARGLVYVQNPSSVIAARCLPLQPDDCVLDLAAAPGGKTSVLASQIDSRQGELWAVDNSRSRFFRLRDNLTRLGIHFVKLVRADGASLRKRFAGYFDKILLDAPCSAEARMNGADQLTQWSLSRGRCCYYKQTALISAAYQMLRPGGLLLYVTCAVSPEENEAVISHFLHRNPSADLLSLSVAPLVQQGLTLWTGKTWPDVLSRAVRIVPTEEYDSLFICLVKKFESSF